MIMAVAYLPRSHQKLVPKHTLLCSSSGKASCVHHLRIKH